MSTEASTTEPAVPPRPARFGPWRREARAFLELFALAGIAFTQPALDILSKNTGVFVTRGSTPLQVLALTLGILVLPALALWGAEVLVGLALPRVRRWVHALAAAGLLGVFALEFVKKQSDLGPTELIAIAVGLGLVGGLLVLRFEVVRLWLRYLSIAPAVFAVLFLFFSPVTTAVFDDQPAAASNVKVGTPHRLVVVVMDEFPTESLLDGTGKIDAALYPNFAALAGQSTWYRNETTVAPYTQTAVPAILSGSYPSDPHALPVAADYPHNLFSLLGGSYKLNVHEVVTSLCTSQLCRETRLSGAGGSGLGGAVEDTVNLWTEFVSPDRTQFSFNEAGAALEAMPTAQRFIRSLRASTSPELDFVHIELPHQPWHYLPTLQDTQNGTLPGAKYLSWSQAWSALSGRERHLLQVQASDTLLGMTIAKLEAVGAWDDSVFVLTADHGVAFTKDQPLRSVSDGNHEQIMWTPLFVKGSHQAEGVVDDRAAISIDVLPTIANMLGVKLPWKLDGHSLLGPPRPDGARRIYQFPDAAIFEPPMAAKPPKGRGYLTYDGPTGFAAVLKSRAAPPGGDPALSIYRVGDFGGLVGRPVASLVAEAVDGPTLVDIQGSGRELRGSVDPRARQIPWAFLEGYLNNLRGNRPLALAVNGVVAGLAEGLELNPQHNGYFFTEVPPALVRPGRNAVAVYAITGTPESPRLDPIPLR